jgi:putative ABC transport system permease protein
MILKLISLNIQSWVARKFSLTITILSIALGFSLILAIQLIQTGLKSSFTGTISKTDLIVGARSGSTQLLLYSVFHIGNPTQNISYSVFKKYESHPSVSWMIPISLGDSHKGYRVVGTDERFFQHYKFRGGKSLSMQSGKWLKNNFGVVLGADIAEKLGYNLEDEITLSHGISQVSFQEHKENPFRITGILNKTFTPVDRSLYVSLDAIDIMHDVKPNPKSRQITAFLLGSRSKLQILNLQREINTSKEEPLQAVLPLIALSDIWTIVENLELVFTILAFIVLVTALLGLVLNLLGTLKERRKEIAILRSLGMKNGSVYFLFLSEGVLTATIGITLSYLFVYGGLFFLQSVIEAEFGIYIPYTVPGMNAIFYSYIGIILAGIFSLLPAYLSYRYSLQDGLSQKA